MKEMSEDGTAGLKLERSTHTAGFTLSPAGFLVTESTGITVEPSEIGVLWANDGDGWVLVKVDVTGRRQLARGGFGKNAWIILFDLEQFPAEIALQIKAAGPRRGGIEVVRTRAEWLRSPNPATAPE